MNMVLKHLNYSKCIFIVIEMVKTATGYWKKSVRYVPYFKAFWSIPYNQLSVSPFFVIRS